MAQQIKFYRGGQEVSLPEIQPGAIIIMQRDDSHGDMFVDVDTNTRLHVVPDESVKVISNSEASDVLEQISKEGYIYYFNNNGQPVIKVGDGTTKIGSLPNWARVTQEEKTLWTNNVLTVTPILLGNNQYNIKFSIPTL